MGGGERKLLRITFGPHAVVADLGFVRIKGRIHSGYESTWKGWLGLVCFEYQVAEAAHYLFGSR